MRSISFPMNKRRCFQRLYSPAARECQVCEQTQACSEATITSQRPVNGYMSVLLELLHERTEVTTAEIDARFSERFSGQKINFYYYIASLKREGLLTVRIDGRQRYYRLR